MRRPSKRGPLDRAQLELAAAAFCMGLALGFMVQAAVSISKAEDEAEQIGVIAREIGRSLRELLRVPERSEP